MSEICVFAGTTEGRRLVEFLMSQPVRVCVCVATDYGESLIPRAENIEISTGRLDEDAMRRFFRARRFDAAIDATHPFAALVSKTLQEVCRGEGVEYLRLNRDAAASDAEAVYVDSIQQAADYLAAHPGAALLTTGSKELKPYTGVENYQARFYLRVLPVQSSIGACEAAGFSPAHVIAMQGPFSVEMNVAMLKAVGAKYLVTKESGDSGGFAEKIEAARLSGARCVVIGRPPQAEGMDYAETVRWLIGKYHLAPLRDIDVIGIGMGSQETLTFEADAALRGCECVIGAGRMLEAVSRYAKPAFAEITPSGIVARMDAHPEYRRFAVVMSGDCGFFSGAKKLLPLLKGERVRVIPGLCSMQALCAKCGVSWDDALAISLHGREGSLAAALMRRGKVFALLDGTDAVMRACADLVNAGMGDAEICVGERLSYPDGKITRGRARKLVDYTCAPLSCLLAEYPVSRRDVRIGLPDDAFVRNAADCEKPVPMTKSEIRAISLSKLSLREDAVVYDIGAGTGSVSVEIALNCPDGHVFAVECRKEAMELIEANRRRYGLRNLEAVCGTAPAALSGLPAPTHAFIGGSGGNMSGIVECLLRKNPRVRIVVNAVTLESAGEIAEIIRKFGFDDAEIVQVSLAKSRSAGRYHLMTGMNPVWIAAMQRREEIQDEDGAGARRADGNRGAEL